MVVDFSGEKICSLQPIVLRFEEVEWDTDARQTVYTFQKWFHVTSHYTHTKKNL